MPKDDDDSIPNVEVVAIQVFGFACRRNYDVAADPRVLVDDRILNLAI